MVQAARNRAKKHKGERGRYDLEDHLPALRARFECRCCEMTGLPFDMAATKKRRWNSPSIDRIDASKGYVIGNVRFVLWALNAGFSDWGEKVFELCATAWLYKRATGATP